MSVFCYHHHYHLRYSFLPMFFSSPSFSPAIPFSWCSVTSFQGLSKWLQSTSGVQMYTMEMKEIRQKGWLFYWNDERWMDLCILHSIHMYCDKFFWEHWALLWENFIKFITFPPSFTCTQVKPAHFSRESSILKWIKNDSNFNERMNVSVLALAAICTGQITWDLEVFFIRFYPSQTHFAKKRNFFAENEHAPLISVVPPLSENRSVKSIR